MKNIFKFSTIFLWLTIIGCSHKITRIDYANNNQNRDDCKIIVKKNAHFAESEISVLGKIKLGDTGFSTKCEEFQAIEILRREGCSLDADIVNILEETRADLWSTCYRVTAEFYKFKDSLKVKDLKVEEEYSSESIDDRLVLDKDNKKNMILGSIIGSVIGLFLVSVLF